MFKSKKSVKITSKKITDTEAVTVNEQIDNNNNNQQQQNIIDDIKISANKSEERMYMNLPIESLNSGNTSNETFYSPSVRVKYSISYEYDEKKFEIFKNEYLFLISKTNSDWWLCLRLDENLTFFVPASYIDEIEVDKTPRLNLMPPPRPPPPPPITTINTKSTIIEKPEVKKRQLVNNHERSPQQQQTQREKSSILEHYTAAEAIINDLEQRLDNEEKSFGSSSLQSKNTLNDNQEIYQNIDNNSSDKTEVNQEEFDDEEEVAEYDDEEDDEEQEDTNNKNEKSCFKSPSILDKLKIPAGWKVCLSECKRYVFYNDINRELWYLNHDANGRHYFYNKDGVSIWQLKELNLKEIEAKQFSTHFKKYFDDDLETFNNLCSRISVRQNSNEASTSTFYSLNETLSDMSKSSKSKTSESSGTSNKQSINLSSENFKCVKLFENGKKNKKKSIEDLHVFLASTKLIFSKVKGGQEKFDFQIDMKGSRCYGTEYLKNNAFIKDKNNNQNISKSLPKASMKRDKDTEEILDLIGNSKYAFIIETLNGYKILLIHENLNTVNDWISTINSILFQINDPNDLTQVFETDPVSKTNRNNPAKKEIQQRSVLDNKPPLPLPDGPPPLRVLSNTNVVRTNIIKQFLSLFLNRRPPIEQLKNKGIIQECIFGSNLISLCRKENRVVPFFVEEIIASIEYRGLEVDGIYRISGNLAEVQKVRLLVDQGKNNFKDFDIHVLCGALKTFFRELEEPLIPFILHQEFLNAINLTDKQRRFEKIRELTKKMPICHRETLMYLCEHLLKVIEQSSQNRMNIQNIALVFGPNIMRSNPINDSNNGFNPNIMTQNVLVEYILSNFKDLFI